MTDQQPLGTPPFYTLSMQIFNLLAKIGLQMPNSSPVRPGHAHELEWDSSYDCKAERMRD
jgi:hypothetical protein